MSNSLTAKQLRDFLATVPDNVLVYVRTPLDVTGEAYYACKPVLEYLPHWSNGVHITLKEQSTCDAPGQRR